MLHVGSNRGWVGIFINRGERKKQRDSEEESYGLEKGRAIYSSEPCCVVSSEGIVGSRVIRGILKHLKLKKAKNIYIYIIRQVERERKRIKALSNVALGESHEDDGIVNVSARTIRVRRRYLITASSLIGKLQV